MSNIDPSPLSRSETIRAIALDCAVIGIDVENIDFARYAIYIAQNFEKYIIGGQNTHG